MASAQHVRLRLDPGWATERHARAGVLPRTPPKLDGTTPNRYHCFMDRPPAPLKEDQQRTRRDIRAALIFGVVAATLELAALAYFFL